VSTDIFDLNGKVGVVVGGARDLGFDMAEILATAGCDLVITSRSLSSAQQSAQRLEEATSVRCRALELDVSDYAQVSDFAVACAEWQGHVDILINNAGGGLGLTPTSFLERPPEHIRKMIDVNVVGLLFCCQSFGKMMTAQGNGKIINIASIAGIVGRDRRIYDHEGVADQPVDYAAAKAAVIGLTRDLAALFGPRGVRVNAISPGGFERGQPEEFVCDYSSRTPLGRMGRDGIDLKGAALFLSSSASDYVTGQNLIVDGGYTIWG
jgi:NAD(P)-dependent dehydrogenase (short-subunit alcohol dehydrogenase family)